MIVEDCRHPGTRTDGRTDGCSNNLPFPPKNKTGESYPKKNFFPPIFFSRRFGFGGPRLKDPALSQVQSNISPPKCRGDDSSKIGLNPRGIFYCDMRACLTKAKFASSPDTKKPCHQIFGNVNWVLLGTGI